MRSAFVSTSFRWKPKLWRSGSALGRPRPMGEPEFVRAGSVDEAIAAIGRAPSDSVIVAGGVVVGSLINQRLVSPAILVDISRIHSLRGIERMPDGGVRIGALVTHEEMRR